LHLALGESLPHVRQPDRQAWFDRSSATPATPRARRRLRGFDGRKCERFVGDVAIEMGSDHEVFQAAGFRVPMAYFHDYPDVTIHTQKDLPENLTRRSSAASSRRRWTLARCPSEMPRFSVARDVKRASPAAPPADPR
jgi:hypothetical protein